MRHPGIRGRGAAVDDSATPRARSGGAIRIGELTTASGTTAKTIRFYEHRGPLPEPARTPGGYRDYGPDQIDRLRFIRQAQAAGLSSTEVRQVLAIIDRHEAPCGHAEQLLRVASCAGPYADRRPRYPGIPPHGPPCRRTVAQFQWRSRRYADRRHSARSTGLR
ncbi:MerR family transcriptional regulator [Nocardia carnea]|uniref:MerR family transcriptional regulator n=1 Tax=Nocardia carnea TaxID=37328 RepID=UPI002457B17C|nr:MerR family transcriptional regulator [Nocardia carnea]